MPAADISEIRVEFGNGIKREEYGPTKSAKVGITAIVGQGECGVAALNYAAKIAQDKVREMLSISGPIEAAPPAAPPSPAVDTGSPPVSTAGEGAGAPPATRTRRTRAQIEADNAAAAEAAKSPSPDTSSGSQASPSSTDEIFSEPQPAEQATAAAGDEWDAGPAPEITDGELNHACSTTAERVKDPIKVRGTIALFNPGGDGFDPAKGGRKFTVNDIPQAQRQAFLDKLKALA